MAASASFSLDEGIRTVSRWATLALRNRVSMSAIGSVIVICWYLLPACLGDAGDLAGVDQLPQADAAQPEPAHHRVRPPAAPATGVPPHLVLRLALCLDHERLFGHD